jgi:hypothetical protein
MIPISFTVPLTHGSKLEFYQDQLQAEDEEMMKQTLQNHVCAFVYHLRGVVL